MARVPADHPSLFPAPPPQVPAADAPLAERMRPQTLEEFVGQGHLVGPQRALRDMVASRHAHSLILWGPPGSGKTSLARIIARSTDALFLAFSAVLSGVKELRAMIDQAHAELQRGGRPAVLFVDEIHRFNKAQQDAFLPHVESGTVVLIGATTENPSFELTAPLMSRVSVVVLRPLDAGDLRTITARALQDRDRGLGATGFAVDPDAIDALVDFAQGDARVLLNTLESTAALATQRGQRHLTRQLVEDAALRRVLRHDKSGDSHYALASALIKSLRGSDPDAALYWMLRLLEAGDDALFVARRLVIFAAEDVGLADPQALTLAVAVKEAVAFVGLPEGRIPLAQAVVYLATAPRSNTAYTAMLAAAEDVARAGALPVPMHLRNAPTGLMRGLGYGAGYQYAHDCPDGVPEHAHLPEQLRDRRYYRAGSQGAERAIAARMEVIERRRAGGA